MSVNSNTSNIYVISYELLDIDVNTTTLGVLYKDIESGENDIGFLIAENIHTDLYPFVLSCKYKFITDKPWNVFDISKDDKTAMKNIRNKALLNCHRAMSRKNGVGLPSPFMDSRIKWKSQSSLIIDYFLCTHQSIPRDLMHLNIHIITDEPLIQSPNWSINCATDTKKHCIKILNSSEIWKTVTCTHKSEYVKSIDLMPIRGEVNDQLCNWIRETKQLIFPRVSDVIILSPIHMVSNFCVLLNYIPFTRYVYIDETDSITSIYAAFWRICASKDYTRVMESLVREQTYFSEITSELVVNQRFGKTIHFHAEYTVFPDGKKYIFAGICTNQQNIAGYQLPDIRHIDSSINVDDFAILTTIYHYLVSIKTDFEQITIYHFERSVNELLSRTQYNLDNINHSTVYEIKKIIASHRGSLKLQFVEKHRSKIFTKISETICRNKQCHLQYAKLYKNHTNGIVHIDPTVKCEIIAENKLIYQVDFVSFYPTVVNSFVCYKYKTKLQRLMSAKMTSSDEVYKSVLKKLMASMCGNLKFEDYIQYRIMIEQGMFILHELVVFLQTELSECHIILVQIDGVILHCQSNPFDSAEQLTTAFSEYMDRKFINIPSTFTHNMKLKLIGPFCLGLFFNINSYVLANKKKEILFHGIRNKTMSNIEWYWISKSLTEFVHCRLLGHMALINFSDIITHIHNSNNLTDFAIEDIQINRSYNEASLIRDIFSIGHQSDLMMQLNLLFVNPNEKRRFVRYQQVRTKNQQNIWDLSYISKFHQIHIPTNFDNIHVGEYTCIDCYNVAYLTIDKLFYYSKISKYLLNMFQNLHSLIEFKNVNCKFENCKTAGLVHMERNVSEY